MATAATAGQSVTLEPGASYRATLVLTGMESWASNSQVLDRIQSAVGPWQGASVQGSGGSRSATGKYAGSRRTVVLPAQVAAFERTDVRPAQPAVPSTADLPVDVVAGRVQAPVFQPPAAPAAPAARPAPHRTFWLVSFAIGAGILLYLSRKRFA